MNILRAICRAGASRGFVRSNRLGHKVPALLSKPSLALDGFDHEGMNGLTAFGGDFRNSLLQSVRQLERGDGHTRAPIPGNTMVIPAFAKIKGFVSAPLPRDLLLRHHVHLGIR